MYGAHVRRYCSAKEVDALSSPTGSTARREPIQLDHSPDLYRDPTQTSSPCWRKISAVSAHMNDAGPYFSPEVKRQQSHQTYSSYAVAPSSGCRVDGIGNSIAGRHIAGESDRFDGGDWSVGGRWGKDKNGYNGCGGFVEQDTSCGR